MNKEQLEIGNCIYNPYLEIHAFVDKILKDKIRVWISNKKCYIPDSEFNNWEFANPIKDNRIVDSKTFAVRFKQFLEWIPKEFYMSGPHILEEYEYMQIIADDLLKYQIQTATDEEEINYLKRLNLL